MRLHWLRISARAVPLEMLQVGVSARDRLRGSLKTECAVLSPERRVAAIPEEATASAMRLFCRTAARRRLMTNVFPVPPGESRKKTPTVFLYTVNKSAVCCFLVIHQLRLILSDEFSKFS